MHRFLHMNSSWIILFGLWPRKDSSVRIIVTPWRHFIIILLEGPCSGQHSPSGRSTVAEPRTRGSNAIISRDPGRDPWTGTSHWYAYLRNRLETHLIFSPLWLWLASCQRVLVVTSRVLYICKIVLWTWFNLRRSNNIIISYLWRWTSTKL